MNGYIKLHKKILKWEWYKKTTVKVVFIHLLILADFSGATRGVVRGVSAREIAKDTGLSVAQVRYALEQLQRTGEITPTKVSGMPSVIKLNNYNCYQERQTAEPAKPKVRKAVPTRDTNNEGNPELVNDAKEARVKAIKEANNVHKGERS